MIFTVEKKVLQAGLSAVKNGLNRKDPTSLFASCIQIVAEGGTLRFQTTNGETHYNWKATEGVKVEQEGSIAANVEKLFSTLPYLTDETVSFATDSNLLHVKAGKIALELKTVADKPFHQLGPVTDETAPISFKGETTILFRRILPTLNRDPAKPKMLGLLLDFKSDGASKVVTLKSVSSTRASKYNIEFESVEPINLQVVLPCFLVDEASKNNLVGLGMSKTHLIAVFSNHLTVTTPVQENIFINPDAVLDAADSWLEIKFKRNEFAAAVNFIKSVCDKQEMKARIMAVDDGTVEISAYTDAGKAKQDVSCSFDKKPNFALNSEHLAELLNSLDGDDIELKVGGRLMTYSTQNYKYVSSLYSQ